VPAQTIPALTAALQTLLATWRRQRTSHLLDYARQVTTETDIDEFVLAQTQALMADLWGKAGAWLVRKLVDLGEAVDEKLQWQFIKDRSLRAEFEKRDNPTALLLGAWADLADAVEEAAVEVVDQDEDDVAEVVALRLLGGGFSARPFGRGRGVVKVDRAKTETVAEPVAEPTDAEQEAADLRVELRIMAQEHSAQIASLTETVAQVTAENEALRSQLVERDTNADDEPPVSVDKLNTQQAARLIDEPDEKPADDEPKIVDVTDLPQATLPAGAQVR